MACTPLDQSWLMEGIKIEKKKGKKFTNSIMKNKIKQKPWSSFLKYVLRYAK